MGTLSTVTNDFSVFAGSAHPALAERIAHQLGVGLGASTTERFPDGETHVELHEPVRGHEVFLVQPTAPPVNDHLVELLALADACRRSAATHVTAIVPYFGYGRSDKRHGRREPVMASLVALLLQAATVDHVVTVDLHAPQIEGFFRVPVDSLTALPVLVGALRERLAPETVVVSPDAGRVKMATAYARRLGLDVVVLHKERKSGTETEATHLVGDVRDRPCLLVDDMIATGGTLRESIERLLEAGAAPSVTVAATHGLFLEGARDKLDHDAIEAVVVTDTIARDGADWPVLHEVSVAPLVAAAIRRFMADGSLSDLF
jgi:ribose-phosphate pyrophosphokinase